MSDFKNPFAAENFRVERHNGGGYSLTVFAQARGEMPTTWAFTSVRDLMAFLISAEGAVVNHMQPSFDFRAHLKGEPAHGPAS